MPKLRGKAIEVRNFCKVLLHLWQKFHNPNLLAHKQILFYLKLSYKVDAILDRHKRHKGEFALSGPVAAEFEKTVFDMGHLVVLLEEHFSTEDVPHLFTAASKPLSCMGLPIRLSGQNMSTCIMYRFWHSPA